MPIRFDKKEVRAATEEEITKITHDIASRVLGTVVLSTPVGAPGTWSSPPPRGYTPGHARGGWQTTVRTPAGSDNLIKDPGGAATIARGIRKLRRAKFGVNIFITSAVPYMGALNRGHSRQAGANFIEKAALRGANAVPSDRRTMPASKRVRPRPGSGIINSSRPRG